MKRISYVGGLLILALALVPANLPFYLYVRGLVKRGEGEVLAAFSATRDLSALPLGLGGRFFYTFFPFMLLTAILFLLWRLLHGKKPLSLITSSERFRFGLFKKGFGLWFLLSFASDLIQFILHRENYRFNFEPLAWLWLLILGAIFLIPQVLLEETFFRAYLIKGGTLFTGKPIIPLLLFSLIFGLLHMANPEVEEYGALIMMPQYIGMGLFLAFLCWETDGLELSLGIHLANNSWGLLFVNSGGTAFETPAPFTLIEWNPLASLIYLTMAMALFLTLYYREKPSLKGKKSFFYNDY